MSLCCRLHASIAERERRIARNDGDGVVVHCTLKASPPRHRAPRVFCLSPATSRILTHLDLCVLRVSVVPFDRSRLGLAWPGALRSRNGYLKDGDLLPFDMILCQPDAELEAFLRLYDSGDYQPSPLPPANSLARSNLPPDSRANSFLEGKEAPEGLENTFLEPGETPLASENSFF